jgi:hypothetical protein
VRIAALKTQSSNNIHQICIAVAAYENERKTLPPNQAIDSNNIQSTIHLPILPYIEGNNLGVYKCPGDLSELVADDKTTYLCNGTAFNATDLTLSKISSMAGTSNTIAIGPRYMDCNGTQTVWKVTYNSSGPSPSADYQKTTITTPTQYLVPLNSCVTSGFSSPFANAAYFGFFDGSVRPFSGTATVPFLQQASDPFRVGPLTFPD